MGRQQHLTRLALGRSAYTDADVPPPNHREVAPSSGRRFTTSGDDPAQTFDARGRPVCAATEVRNAAQRDAQNDVLKLFGFLDGAGNDVDHVPDPDRATAEAPRSIVNPTHTQAAAQRRDEDRIGDTLVLVAELARDILTWWPSVLLARAVAGLYPAALPFAGVMATELRFAWRDALVGTLSTVLTGAPARVLHTALSTVLAAALRELVGRAQQALLRRERSRSARHRRSDREREHDAAVLVYDILLLGVHAALLPLDYFAAMQQLGLAPAWPLLPSWRFFSLSSPDSIFNIDGPYPRHPLLLRVLTTPASLLLLRTSIISAQPKFEYESLNEPTRANAFLALGDAKLPVSAEPTFGIMTSIIRRSLLPWSASGRTVQPILVSDHAWMSRPGTNVDAARQSDIDGGASPQAPSPPTRPQSWPLPPASTQKHPSHLARHRPSLLALLPARFFASSIDGFANRILNLPLDILTWRALVASADARSVSVAVTGAAGAVSLLAHRSSGGQVGSDVSKAGLALALRVTIEMGLFVGVYGAVRWIGSSGFGWHRRREARESQARGGVGDTRETVDVE